jgi:tetratricopeptide (TPR) repeat protein
MSVHIWEETVTIPTYPVGKANPHPPLQRRGYWAVYPYPLLDALSDEAQPREYRALMLENPYLRVMVLPELGGRVWSLYDKIGERECLHQPPSIKPALIGLTGAWIAGGIEFNFPIGHRYTTHQPVWYTLSYPKEEGDKATIWIGEICRRSRMMWMVGISLYPDTAFMETDIRLFNRTELKKRFYFWTNCAVSAHEEWQWILPASSVRNWEGDLSEARATLPFPVTDDGTDLSLYRSYDRASSVFAHDSRGDFFGGYDLREDTGLLHVANPRDACGRKLFTWGTADDGAVWAERLDDRGVPYVEIQTGRFEDQSIWHWIPPHSLECWQEAWYPIRGLQGTVSAASRDGALSVQLLGQQLQVRFHSTAPRPDHRLILQYGEDVVHEQRVDLYPERTGNWQFTLPQPAQLPLKVLIATGARDTILEAIANPVVERERITIPPAPSGDDAQTYFLQADALERGALLDEAEAKYRQALDKLPEYLPALNALARMCLEDGRWDECLQYTERALRRDPQNHEAMYLRALCLVTQGRDAEAEEWLYPLRRSAEYRGLAFYLLAICAMRRQDVAQADDLLAECLLYNAADVKAWMMRAAVLRLRGEVEEAAQVRLQVHLLAPLEPLLRTEAYLSTPESPETDAVNLLKPLAMQAWGFEEVACDYLNAGCATDAIRILEASARLGLPEQAITHYLLALAYSQKGLLAQVAEHALLAARSEQSYLFPWRLEDYHALQKVLVVKPNDTLARYALGNWLAAHRRWEDALHEWLMALDSSVPSSPESLQTLGERCLQATPPELPVAPTLYRNIGLALSEAQGWHDLALRYYERALSLSPDDHYLWVERDAVARRAGIEATVRLQWLEQASQQVLQENRTAQLHAHLLVQAQRYDDAIRVLHSLTFHVAEGETSTRPVWVGAHLGKGKQMAQRSDWQGALEHFKHALEYPHHLAVGKPVHPADAIPLFWAGLAARQLGNYELAQKYWQEAIRCAAYSERDKAHQAVALELLGRREEAQQLAQVEGIAREMQQLREEIAATRAETTSFEGEAFHP